MTDINCPQQEIANIDSLCKKFAENNPVDKTVYANPSVKQGLRNADGSGVVAGVSRICNVHGYVISEGEREPIDGKLVYRGIDLYNLIGGIEREKRFGFDEISYLLLIGNLPTRLELDEYMSLISKCRNLPRNFTEDVIMRAPSNDIMNKLASATLSLYSFDENPDDISVENVLRQGIDLIAKFPLIVSHAYQARRRYFQNKSMYLHVPDPTKSTAENILGLIRHDGVYTNDEARLLDIALCLHAEHGGGNNSTFANRVVSSSDTDTYAAISAAVGSLKGPKHGGANLKVREMFEQMLLDLENPQDEDEVLEYLCKILRKEVGDKKGLIYGMGHAIYMLSDPRAVILKEHARKLSVDTGFDSQFKLLDAIERLTPIAFKKVRNVDKVMCANVDLYSGLVYKMLKIPREMYTPLFASARIAGWMAHRLEEITISGKIIRPAFKAMLKSANYVPISKR